MSFDPKTLSDDELLTRADELQQKLVQSSRYGSGMAVGQLQYMLSLINEERRERAFMESIRQTRVESPVVIETDPDLRNAQLAAEASRSSEKRVPSNRSRITVRRPVATPNPVIQPPRRPE